ncbi:GTP-binding protein [Clostridia bacterium]|nr:GTP-binding protein [Clostridia bacterium]
MTVEFIKSAADTAGFIVNDMPKLLLAGRSNVGKSSLINRAAGRAAARVSATPGKTASVNYYLIDGNRYWIDLPGYGYAKVSQSERARWAALMEEFFAQLDGTYRGLLIVDIRHKPTAQDVDMARCFRDLNVPFKVAANKSDKLKPSQTGEHLRVIDETLNAGICAVPCSAEKDKAGILCELL